MRRVLMLLPVAVLVTGCATAPSPTAPAAAPTSATRPATPRLPAAPQPTDAGPCPYLDSRFVAKANGQRVLRVQTSADKPNPACFFYALSGKLQLSVQVYVGDPAVALGLVDQAAPVGTSDPAAEPAGWRGGYQPTGDGAVYAVAKQGAAVVVSTDQKQSVKARTVAEQVIAALQL